MALQLWLPLNGNIRNQGLCDVEISGNPNSWENGKIGKCAKFNGGQQIYTEATNLFSYTDNFTWACWIIPNYQSGTQWAFTCGRADAGGYGYGLQIQSVAECKIWFGRSIYSINTINDTWQHIAFTKKGNNIRIYLNGECVINTTFTGDLPTWSYGHFSIGIGCFHYSGQIYHCNSSINDFRLYDTALSAREIREIYNNPVVHFPLNQIDKSNNLYTGSKNFSGDNWYNINLWIEDGTYNGFTVRKKNTSWGVLTQNKNVNAGEIYTCSLYIKSDTANNFQFYPNLGNSGLKYTEISSSKIADLEVNKWYRIYKTVKITEDGLMRFGVEPTQKGGTVWICGMKLEKNETPTDWTPAWQDSDAWFDKVEYDTSGYCNNGIVEESTSPSVSQSASQSKIVQPRYSRQYYFSGKDYIKFQNPFYGQKLSQLTINFWVKVCEGSRGFAKIFGEYAYGASWCPWISVNCEGSGLWGFVNGGNNYLKGNGKLSLNTWYMATFIFKDGKAQWYLNGQKNTEPTVFSNGLIDFTNVPNLSIGNSYRGTSWATDFVGYLSDFRMYANALTEPDIKRLYNTSASLDSQGNLILSGEVIE